MRYITGSSILRILLLLLLLNSCQRTSAEEGARKTPDQESKPTRILAGGYPEAEDFVRLKGEGVKTIVTLLDDRLPEELSLIKKEGDLAKENGMTLVRIPMSSRLSKYTSATYRAKVESAAQGISQQAGVVYFHCYHGVHRTGSVEELLRERGYSVTDFTVTKRQDESDAIDRAQTYYERGDHPKTIETLKALPHLDHRAHALLGWAYYRNGDVTQAKRTFDNILERIPEADEASTGRGYVALRENDLKRAESSFKAVLEEDSENVDAELGLGILRLKQLRYEPAQRHFNTVLKLEPNNAEALKYLREVSGKMK